MNKDEYTIVAFKEKRFAIVDKDGVIIDDAQGHGYKTEKTALNAFNAKFAEKESKINGIAYSDIQRKYDEYSKIRNRDLYKKDITPDDIFNEVEDLYNIIISDDIREEIKITRQNGRSSNK